MTHCTMPTERVYQSLVMIVTNYLTSKTVSTATDLIEDTGIEPHQYQRMIKDGILTTSLNHEHNWVTLTNTINKNKDHWKFFKYRIKKNSRTDLIFHIWLQRDHGASQKKKQKNCLEGTATDHSEIWKRKIPFNQSW